MWHATFSLAGSFCFFFFFVPTAKSQQTFWCNKHSCTVQDRSTFFFFYLNPPRIEMFTHITIRSLFPPPFFLLKKKNLYLFKKRNQTNMPRRSHFVSIFISSFTTNLKKRKRDIVWTFSSVSRIRATATKIVQTSL